MAFALSDIFKSQKTFDRFHGCGFFSSYLGSFGEWLEEQKFSALTIQKHVSHIAHFSYSFDGVKPELQDIDKYIQHFFNKHIPTCTCKGWLQPKKIRDLSHSINRFKEYLSDCHGIDFQSEELAYTEIHHEYLCWLCEELQLANGTITTRSNYLKRFLQWYKVNSDYQTLPQIKPYDVELFYIEIMSQCGKSSRHSFQVTLRSFFDFCHKKGYIKQNLRFSIPVARTYQYSAVPKQIEDSEALRCIKSIDQSTISGKRSYAILIILYTYGVRGCQVRRLTLKDIDWYKEEIHFPSAKNGKSLWFPLTNNVGNALLDYVKYARKKCRYKEVFLTLNAPIKPLNENNSLSQIIRYCMLKAGITSPSKGAHCFRHCFVSRMLSQGESFKYIADFLGHKHIKATFIYTKIDFHSLADVALELPEVAYENL